MPRAVTSLPRHRRHRKLIRLAKGYYGARSRNFRTAKDAVIKALRYAYRDRRQRKRQFRRLWIIRINAAARQRGMTYSQFMHVLREQNINLNRKLLADMAVQDPDRFDDLLRSIAKS